MTAALPTAPETLASWLLTYLVHSSLLLGATWLLARTVVTSPAWREALWKTALVGAVVSTIVAASLPRPLQLEIPMPAVAALPGIPTVWSGEARGNGGGEGAPSGAEAMDPDASGRSTEDRAAGPAEGFGTDEATRTSGDRRAAAGGTGAEEAGVSWAGILGAVWLLLATALLLRLGIRHARLRWLLRRRRALNDEEAAGVLAELRRTAGVWRPVRLSATPAVATPLVLGGSEICVPERFLDLDPDEQRAALAHELGHVARRDPWWHLLAAGLEAVFFFQPLQRAARSGLSEAAEYRADEWAVRHASRLSLARCLAEVAQWVVPGNARASTGALAMAEGGSSLLSRARRLVAEEPERSPGASIRYGSVAAVVLATAGLGPAVVPSVQDAGPPEPTGPAEVARVDDGIPADDPGPQAVETGADTVRTAVRESLGRYLVSAAERGERQTAARLIESGADVDHRIPGDGTPLIVAARAGHLGIVELLLEHGAEVDRASPGDGNPLIMAAAHGHEEMVVTLVESGASVNAVIRGDETPLINAARSGHPDIVEYLVEHGADVNLSVLANPETRPEVRSPLGEAMKSGHDEIAEYLRRRGATLPEDDAPPR